MILTPSDIIGLSHFQRAKTVIPEFQSACPKCGGAPSPQKIAEGRGNDPPDRFRSWPLDNGQYRFWCRRCVPEFKGFTGTPTKEEAEALTQFVEDRVAQDYHEFLENKQRIINTINRESKIDCETCKETKDPDCPDCDGAGTIKANLPGIYHHRLNGHTPHLAQKWGLEQSTIDYFRIGYCNLCPTCDREHPSDSYTIPYFWHDLCIRIRHRLLQPSGGDKYRPHAAGMGNALFNSNVLQTEDSLIMVEGEFKTCVLWQNLYQSIALSGVTAFKPEWVPLFENLKRLYIVLDPGEAEDYYAHKYGKWLAEVVPEVRIVSLFAKPDDLFTEYGVDTLTFSKFLDQGRLVQ